MASTEGQSGSASQIRGCMLGVHEKQPTWVRFSAPRLRAYQEHAQALSERNVDGDGVGVDRIVKADSRSRRRRLGPSVCVRSTVTTSNPVAAGDADASPITHHRHSALYAADSAKPKSSSLRSAAVHSSPQRSSGPPYVIHVGSALHVSGSARSAAPTWPPLMIRTDSSATLPSPAVLLRWRALLSGTFRDTDGCDDCSCSGWGRVNCTPVECVRTERQVCTPAAALMVALTTRPVRGSVADE